MEAFMVDFGGIGGCIIAKDIKELRDKYPNAVVLNAFCCGGLTLSHIAGEEKSDHRALLELFLGMAYFANSKIIGPDCYETSWHREQSMR